MMTVTSYSSVCHCLTSNYTSQDINEIIPLLSFLLISLMFLLSLFHRSKRGVENKVDYGNSKGERWPVAMVKKRLSLAG